jgi:hypothetical protein
MHRLGTRLGSSDPLHVYGSDLHNISYLDHPAVGGIALRDHLIDDRHRREPEIDGLTLEDLHRFEQAMGPSDLGHRHSADATTIQQEVFTPAGVRDAVCGPAPEGLLTLPELSDTSTPGFVIPGGPSACSSGGWSITPASMLRIARSLLAGDLLPDDLRRQMDDGRLGWDCPGPAPNAVLGKAGASTRCRPRWAP